MRNELQNSNFEGGNTGWSSWGYSSVIQNPSLAHSGAWLMGVSTTNPNGGGAYQIVSAVPNAIYALSGWGKQTVNDGTSFLGAQCLDSSNNLIAGTSQSQVFSGTDYSQYSCSITTPWNTAKIQVFLWKGAGSGGYLYADDLNLSLVQTGLNQLQNPGFENQNVGWGDWGYRNAVNTPSSAVHSGTWGMGITAGSSYGGTYQIVPAVPNAIYGLSGWGKQTVDDGTSSFGAECLDSNNNVIGIPQSQVFSGTNYSWYLFGFTTPANTAKILVYLWKGVGSGSLYADDLYLLKY